MDNNTYEFECIALDVPTINDRIYPRSVMERELARYKKDFVDKRRAMVTITTDSDTEAVNLKNVIGILTEASIKDNKLVVKVETLDTDAFRSLLVDGKFDPTYFRVAPFGIATTKDNVVQEDYELIGFHIALDYGRK